MVIRPEKHGRITNPSYTRHFDQITGQRTVGSVAMTLIKVADQRLGETEVVRMSEGFEAVYCSRVRSLVDAVYDWSRFNSLPQGYDWIRGVGPRPGRRQRNRPGRPALRQRQYAPPAGPAARMRGDEPVVLSSLENRLSPSLALIPWVPTLPKRGPVDRRWGVVVYDGS